MENNFLHREVMISEGTFFKGKESKFRLGTRRHWNRLPKEALDVLYLEVFKTKLDGALSTLV